MILLQSLILPSNDFLLLGALALIAWIGVTGDRRNWFKKVSGILISMALSGLLVTINVLPSGANDKISVPVYNGILKYFVLLAIPLLLFDVNFKKIKKESGRMLGIFLIGTVGVIIGGIIAGLVVPLPYEDNWKLSGILTGTYIGGSMNFVALSTMFDYTKSPLFSSAVAADNIFTNVYLFLLILLPGVKWIAKYYIKWQEPIETITITPIEETINNNKSFTENALLSLGISALVIAFSIFLSNIVQQYTHTDFKLDVLFITIITVILANLFPKFLKPLQATSFDTGLFLLYMFLAVVGTNADFKQLLTAAPQVFLMVFIIMFVHLTIVLFFGKMFNYSLYEIGLSSCANISGPSVCVPLAAAYKTKSLVTPVILVAILSYAMGNIAGFFVGWLFR